MKKETRLNTLVECHRILHPGGSLFIIEYDLPSQAVWRAFVKAMVKLTEDNDAYLMLAERILEAELEQTGFSVRRQASHKYRFMQVIEAIAN